MRWRAIFLDCGGVLQLPHHDRIADALARAGATLDGDADRLHYDAIRAVDAVPPDAGERAVWEAFVAAYLDGATFDAERRRDVVRELGAAFRHPQMWSRTIPGAVDALRALVEAVDSVVIVSNSDGGLEGRLREEGICQAGPGAGVTVAGVIDSGAVGVSKPDPAIFRLALDIAGVEPSAAVHVGDSVRADVRGADAAGVHPVHLDPYAVCGERHDHVRSVADVLAMASG